jgi:beta-phosphoglucomutase-like phosphatase (HAD superfamily)
VEHGKPDPEIYNLIAEELRISHSEVIAVEDSYSGVKAALTAQISCVAVPSDFTRAGVHKIPPAPNLVVVDNQSELLDTVKEFISKLNSEGEKVN